MAWTLLGIAGIVEIAFAFAMKRSEGFTRLIPACLRSALVYRASFFFLFRCAHCRWEQLMRFGPASVLRALRF